MSSVGSNPILNHLPALAGLVALPLVASAQPAGQLWFGFERTSDDGEGYQRFEMVTVEGASCVTIRRPDASLSTACAEPFRFEFPGPETPIGEPFSDFAGLVRGLGSAANCTGSPADSTCLWIIVVEWPEGPASVYFLQAVFEDALLEFDLPPVPVLSAPRASHVTLGDSPPFITWSEPTGVPEADAVAIGLGGRIPSSGDFFSILRRDTYASTPALVLSPGPGIQQFSVSDALVEQSLPGALPPGDYAADLVYARVFADLFILQTFTGPITHVSGPEIDWATSPMLESLPSVPDRPLITTAGIARRDFSVRPELACLEADYTGDRLLAIDDITAYIDAFLSSDPAVQLTADLNHDLVLDTADIARFVDLFLNGC